jgi:hypothetical protein
MVDQHGKSKSSALALNFSVGRDRLLIGQEQKLFGFIDSSGIYTDLGAKSR